MEKNNFFEKINLHKSKKRFEKAYQINKEFSNLINNMKKLKFEFKNIDFFSDIFDDYLNSYEICIDSKKECKQIFKYYRKKLDFYSDTIAISLIKCIHKKKEKGQILSSFLERSFPKKWILKDELDNKECLIPKEYQKTLNFEKNSTNIDLFDGKKSLFIYSKDEEKRQKVAATASVFLISEKEFKVIFIDERTLIMKIKKNWQINNTFLFDTLVSIDLLVIDNFGLGNVTSGIRDDFLYPLFLHRFNNSKTIYFLSSFEPNLVEKEFRFNNSAGEISRSTSFKNLIKKYVTSIEFK